MAHAVRFRRESQTEFAKAFRPLGERHSAWQAWADFVDFSAISIFMPFGLPGDEKHQQREKEYMSIAKRYTPAELEVFARLLAMTVDALEDEPEQDFLGEMFMTLELSNHWKGQFFTPYSICKMMAEITMQDAGAKIDAKGWVGICDCCCGAGALLIAARNRMQFANPPIGHLPGHLQTLYVCQDVDRTAALMCYIQLSLLGCAGYVVIGNAITHPLVGFDNNPVLPIETEGQDIWCMPMFHDQVWVWRQAFAKLDALTRPLSREGISDIAPAEEATESAAERPAEAPELLPPPAQEAVELNVTSTGQLTLF